MEFMLYVQPPPTGRNQSRRHRPLRDAWGVRLSIDGVTPVPRMLLLSEFLLHADFQVELNGPVFVAAGERVSYEAGGVVG
jgi:hypothetical protein